MQSTLEVSIDDVAKHLEDCMTQIVAAFSEKSKSIYSNTSDSV